MLLDDKVAVIHGGGGSIGAAAARVFAREGARLYLAGRSLPRLEAAASGIRADGGSVEIAVVDAMDQDAVDRHADEVADAAGGIDIALNTVGFDHVQGLAIADTSLDDYLHPVTGYLRTNFVTAKAAARHMLAAGERRDPHDLDAGRPAHRAGPHRQRGAERRTRGVLAGARRRARTGGRAGGVRAAARAARCVRHVVHG